MAGVNETSTLKLKKITKCENLSTHFQDH